MADFTLQDMADFTGPYHDPEPDIARLGPLVGHDQRVKPEVSQNLVPDMSATTMAAPASKAAFSSSPTPAALPMSISPGKVATTAPGGWGVPAMNVFTSGREAAIPGSPEGGHEPAWDRGCLNNRRGNSIVQPGRRRRHVSGQRATERTSPGGPVPIPARREMRGPGREGAHLDSHRIGFPPVTASLAPEM
jgi:hypothetical protein